jgi:hypothetical protein
MEAALTRELGVGWIERADGTGREIGGVSQAMIDLFSYYRDDEDKRPGHPVSPDSERQEPPAAEPSEHLSLRDEMKQMGWF